MNTVSTQRIWDPAIRIFHWVLVLLIPLQWALLEFEDEISDALSIDALQWHARFGYCLLFMILFRLLWGLWGTRTARFAEFLRGPSAVIAYLRELPRPDAKPVLGHNPGGGWMIMLMLMFIAIQAGTGLFSSEDEGFSGPLAHWLSGDMQETITEWHEENFNFIMALVLIHIAAIVFYKLYKRKNLITAMLNGRGNAPTGEENSVLKILPLLSAVLLAAFAVYWLTAGGW